MGFFILSSNRAATQTVEERPAVKIVSCHFERSSLYGLPLEGGILTCVHDDGRESQLHVAITWSALAELRNELARAGSAAEDACIIRAVLPRWGIVEFTDRVREGRQLPGEDLILDSLGGPTSNQARRLLEAAGLLPIGANFAESRS